MRTTLFGAVCLLACSSSSGAGDALGGGTGMASGGNAGMGVASGGAQGGAGGAGSSAKAGGAGLLIDVGSGAPLGGAGGLGQGEACAAEVHGAERLPVDIHIMLDISGSMLDPTATGPTKWDATRQALSTFVASPQSNGLGVGIQYFPLRPADVPAECTSSAQCGAWGPCVLNICENAIPDVLACDRDADCGSGDCVPLGVCSATEQLCVGIGEPCSGGLLGAFDTCEPLTRSICDQANCDASTYRRAAVPIATLPDNATALVGSISRQEPNGGTPTSVALAGALDYARSYAQANSSHTVAVVFATDGLPTDCGSTEIADISRIAATALADSPSIRTFVVGVFGPDDLDAPANLNAIARAGGTTSAFIVDTSQNVTNSLTAALNAIRGATLACEFRIPPPAAGNALDFDEVNVAVTNAGSTTNLFYVREASGCDPQRGGWYYDIQPGQGTSPTQIKVCPATCDALSKAPSTSVEIRLGCETIVEPPR